MFKFGIVCVIAFVALQEASTRATPKAKSAGKSEIDELATNARQVVQNVSAVIEGNLPDSKQVSETLTQTSQQLATKVKDFVDDLNKQAQEHKGDIENVITEIKQSLANTANKLQETIGPDAVKKAKEIKANLDEGLNKAIAEAEKLAKAAEPEAQHVKNDLTNTAKNILDNVVQLSKSLKMELDRNLAKA
ncbi:protein DR_1172-like [Euwallacea fornicatus]|uniref:protein DR_1172-like n=1 Tax=Euwallacea fornicatus TaxID=995702 RepID=UPI00338F6035